MRIVSPTGKSLNFNNRKIEYNNTLVYYTNFQNLDLTNINTSNYCKDIPIQGPVTNWNISAPVKINKTDITVDGVIYPALYVGYGTTMSLVENLFNLYGNIISIEAITYKPNYGGCWGSVAFNGSTAINYNCWSGGRGIGINCGGNYKKLFNNFYHIHDGIYYADFYNHADLNKLAYGGTTTDLNNKEQKSYLFGKKAIIQNKETANGLSINAYNGGWGNFDFYILELKIYTNDRFEMMEG